MATVTYKNQPAIDKTKGNVPLAGTSHLYTVKKVLWPNAIEFFLKTLLVGKISAYHLKYCDLLFVI